MPIEKDERPLLERLRAYDICPKGQALCQEAADEIDRLRGVITHTSRTMHDPRPPEDPLLAQLRTTIGLLGSAVRCGEPWTDECQREFDAGLSALKDLSGK